VDSFVVCDIGNHQLDQIVRITGHKVATDHFRNLHDRSLELIEMVFLLAGERDLDKHGGSEADTIKVERSPIPSDHSSTFESFHTTQAGRRGEMDLLCKGSVCHSAVGLQEIEDGAVSLVDVEHADFVLLTAQRHMNHASNTLQALRNREKRHGRPSTFSLCTLEFPKRSRLPNAESD
jgi:hypothetical protein